MTSAAVLEELASRPGRFPGSLLLTGESDARLETEARRLAALLLCPGGDPRAVCGACRRALAGIHPDLLVVEPEGVQIRVERIREALAFGAGRPYEAPRRVAIIARADLLGDEGANALLKSLEEPGRDLHWILTTTRPELLLPTIRSRCATASLAPISQGERERAWRERGFSEIDAADLARSGASDEGAGETLESYRDARDRIAGALASGLARRSISSLLLLAEDLAKGDDRRPARIAAEILADAALGAEAPAPALRHPAAAARVREISAAVPADALRRAVLKAVDAPPDNRRGNLRFHWEALLIEMWEAAGKKD